MTSRILTILRLAGPHGMQAPMLRMEYSVRYGSGLGETDLLASLQDLERKGLASHRRDLLTDDTVWSITEAGEAALTK